MIRKLGILAVAMFMVFAVSACGSSEPSSESDTETEATEVLSGGWEIADNVASALPEDVQTAFDKASEQFVGSTLKPVAYVAQQVVAGMNYMILCEAETATETPQKSYQMIVVYADLEGNAEITSIKDFDFTAYTEGGSTEINTEQLAGGWTVAEPSSSVVMPEEAKEALDKAAAELDGNVIEPMALLGTQVVAGTNYAFLCSSTLTTEETVRGLQVVTVYADLEGNAEISNISTVDPADFTE